MSALLRAIACVACACAPVSLALADQAPVNQGFFEGASSDVLIRNYYFDRDYRKGASNNFGASRGSYRQEWAQGANLAFSSGFTQGTLGWGLDAYARGGLRLDSGGGTTGTMLLPIGDSRRAHAAFGTLGGAVKVNLSHTRLYYGDVAPANPVFFVDTSARLLSQLAHGWQLISEDISGLKLDAGRFTSGVAGTGTTPDILRSAYSDKEVKRYQYAGGRYTLSSAWDVSLFTSEAKDFWRLYYLGSNYSIPLAGKRNLRLSFNGYRSTDAGAAVAGPIDGVAGAISAAYTQGAHTFTLVAQKNQSDTPLDEIAFADRKASGLSLPMAMMVDEFQGPRERAFQFRYEVDMGAYAIPGLKLAMRYGIGRTDGSHVDPSSAYKGLYGPNGRHWESNYDVQYAVQGGWAKDLRLRLRYAVVRENKDQPLANIDEVRFIIEYPVKLL
ncbi:OprD family outer membrane porin [Pseudomonas putida]|uniref:OprD family outer membrane porin n=1 Tax=Pseudomonas putida TaxID=303 RepID=UPI00383BAB2C